MTPIKREAVVCSTCNGDPRVSLTCSRCGGAGVGIPSPFGFLVWDEVIDDFSIFFRATRRKILTAFHLLLLIASLFTLVFFAWHASQFESFALLLSPEFWFQGHPAVTALWFGLLLGCFLVFRLSEYTRDEKTLPTWGLTKKAIATYEKSAAATKGYRFSITPYFSGASRSVIENAYVIAKTLHRTEVTPVALFASVIASAAGGNVLVRLGMPFEKLKDPLARLLTSQGGGNPPITLSRETKRVLASAYLSAYALNRRHVEVMDLFLEAFASDRALQDLLDQLGFPPEHVQRVGEWMRIRDMLREDHDRFTRAALLKPKTTMNRSMTARQTPLLDRFSEDVTLDARNGLLAPIVGRTRELDEMMRAFESGSRSVVLIGPTGAGKTAIIDQIGRRMVEEDVPSQLFDKRLVAVHIPQILAGGDPGLASERFLTILHEAQQSGNIVLVMHGVETLVGEAQRGPLDLVEILSQELEKGGLMTILTSTPEAWSTYLERRTLAARIAKVSIGEMSTEETLQVLMARSGFIEYQQKVFFSYAALEKAATLASRYLHDVAAPENALGIIREAAVLARKARGEKTFVTDQDVASVIHDKTNIPVEAVTTTESQKLLSLESHLHERVIGQDQAVVAVSQALRRARADVREGDRPIANFLFVGPTGVGKTELAKALAAEYFGNESAMVRLDMSEYQEQRSTDRLITFLTDAIRQTPFTVVLLDELEKAHPDILNLFLQVMDDGRLTNERGKTIDFTNVMLIATSNAGTAYVQQEIAKGTSMDVITTGLMEKELRTAYRPEFLNRFDGIIVFTPLTLDHVTAIARLMIAKIASRLESQKGMLLRVEEAAIKELASAGFDPQFGARPLRRVIQEKIDTALADLILKGEVQRKDTIVFDVGGAVRVEKAPMV